jgi:hypothetical protein
MEESSHHHDTGTLLPLPGCVKEWIDVRETTPQFGQETKFLSPPGIESRSAGRSHAA